jgi:GNAT superfamily N-acetyltransferase
MYTDSGDITIRKAGLGESYARIIPPDDLAAYTGQAFGLEQVRSELTDADVIYLLALAGDCVCGYAKLVPTRPPPEITAGGAVELKRLYAAAGWTGKGIGTQLIEAALKAAVGAGYRCCWLQVWQGNAGAVRFYRKWDFREIGSRPYAVGQTSETVLLMVRPLNDLTNE